MVGGPRRSAYQRRHRPEEESSGSGALGEDPACEATVNDSVSPVYFVNRSSSSGTRDNLATSRENPAHDSTAVQTLGVAALDHLRQVAELVPQRGRIARDINAI